MAKRLGSTFVGLYRSYGRLRGKTFSKLAAGAFASFGARSVLEPPIRLGGEHRIAIGDDVFIGGGSWLLTVGEGDVALTIGNGTRISGACVISATRSVRIGSEVLFARNVYLSDHGHGHDDPGRAIVNQGITEPRPVEIADGAWLGENVVVCPGVSIGRGAVIGANAVVLSDIPDHAVAVGVPARVVQVSGSRVKPSSDS